MLHHPPPTYTFSIKCKNVRTMGGHSARVGTMAWNAHCLASGSRDRSIFLRDVRAAESFTSKLVGHKQVNVTLDNSHDASDGDPL